MKNKIVLLVAAVLIIVFSAVTYVILPNLLVRISTVEIAYSNGETEGNIVITPDYKTNTLGVLFKSMGVEKKSSGVIGEDFHKRMENILKEIRGKGDVSCDGVENYKVNIVYSKKNWGVQSENICVSNEKFALLDEFYKNVIDLFSHDVY